MMMMADQERKRVVEDWMERRRRNAKDGKLPTQFDMTTLKPIGENHSTWSRDLSVHGKQCLPLQVASYHKIDSE